MKRKKILSLVITGIMVASLAMTGCSSTKSGNDSPVPSNTNSSANAMDKDQHITVSIPVANIKTLDASKGTDAYSAYILQECMASIAREEVKDGKSIFVPDGAKKWEVSPDGKVWTISLRESKWSDGQDVTAEQYEYSVKRTLAKETASQYAYLLVNAGIKGAADYNAGKGTADNVGVKAVDKLTLQITLDQPCAYFEKLLSQKLFMPQRKDMIEKNGAAYGTKAETLVYNGPFKISNFTNGSKVEMVKNDQYWDKDSVKLEKLTMLFMGDENARMNAFMSGQVDRTGVATGKWKEKFDADSRFDSISVKYPSTSYMFFNTKSKYFSNAKIRRAFSLAFDREDYVKVIRQGIGQPSYSWTPPSVQIGNDEYRDKVKEQIKECKEDPKKLLVEGLKEIGESEDLSKVSISYLESGTDELAKQSGDYMINMCKTKLGITLKVDYMEWAQYNDAVNNGKYEYTGMGWGGDYNDPMTFFDMWESGAGVVVNYWENKKYDELIEGTKGTMDQAKRLENFQKAEQMLVIDEAVIIPMFYQQGPVYTYKYVKGIQTPLFAPASVEWKYAYTSGRGK